MNFYNEIDPIAAQWLRNLIDAGHIAPGIVDERSIEEITPDELRNYNQCHFFAGIGVWSYALRLAGVPDDYPIWTGSCPCQPFSAAGKGAGFADERHLWPAFHWLIHQRRPAIVLGEQVASQDGLAWLDLVQADLEGSGYATGASDLCAVGVGAPHIRQRLYWVAHPHHQGLEGLGSGEFGGLADANSALVWRELGSRDGASGAVQAQARERERRGVDNSGGGADVRPRPTNGFWSAADWLHCRDGKWRPVEPGTFPLAHGAAARVGRLRAYGNAIVPQVAQAFIEAVLGR